MKLGLEFYARPNPAQISKDLIGKVLYTLLDGELTSGVIAETEAYMGPEDRGSHAYGNRRTPRTEVMFQAPGHAYVYLCYGLHYLFNVVTGPVDTPHAVLIRAVEPLAGIDIMKQRRGSLNSLYSLTAGPGSVARALGIAMNHNGLPVNGNVIWIEDENRAPTTITESARVGMNFEGYYHSVPWRFRLAGSPWTSKAK